MKVMKVVALFDVKLSYDIIKINLRGVCLSVRRSCSPLPCDQPWSVRYQEKAHDTGKVWIIFSMRCINEVHSYTTKYEPHTTSFALRIRE